MNKQRFIDYLRSPERLNEGQFSELQKLLTDYPYFTIAKSIAARAAKDLDMPEKNGLIASAAIYATDRKHLKKYINGELVFLAAKPVVADDSPVVESIHSSKEQAASHASNASLVTESQEAHVDAPASAEVDQMIDELHRDIDELKKSRMHFVDIQNQIDEETANASKRQKKEPDPEAPAPIATSASEEVSTVTPEPEIPPIERPAPPVSEEKQKEPKPVKEAPIKFDLDALKRELAREEEEKEKKRAVKESAKPKEKAPRAKRVRDDEDEDLKEPPPVVNVPGSITNMSPAEENDEDEDADLKLPRKKSARKPRKPIAKIKREDLEKVLGKKIPSTTVPKVEKEEAKAPVKKEEKKAEEGPLAVALKEKEPKAIKPKKEKTAESIAEVPTAPVQVEKTPKPVAETPTPEPPTVVEEMPVAPMSKETAAPPPPREEEPLRNSIRAFLDFGTSVERASVSRASSSRSKRSARANRSRPSDEGTGDGKGDDESGGAGSLIDKFIQENPSIQRRPNADDKSDLSEGSSKWNPELASEYLAQIYLDQGNTKRAILIYETLSLKFPEKKSYFAGLIEKLKK